MRDIRAIGRRLTLAIPAAVIAAVAGLHWSGEIRRPDAQAASNRPTPAPSPAPSARPAWQADWPGDVPMRNLFLTRLDNFPRDIGTAQQPIRPGEAGFETKSPADPADHMHDAPPSGMAAEISRIHLQSTMMQPAPRALVDGQMVGEGDFVGAFRVVRITLTQIVLEKQGVQFQITLK